MKLENVKTRGPRPASRVVVDKENDRDHRRRAATSARSKAREQQLAPQIGKTKSDYDKEKLQERLAKLAGGVAVIRVGAPSEAELKSRKEAFEDAVSATKAAVAEGIVPGGGLALLRAIEAVEARGGAMRGRRADRAPDPRARAARAPTRQYRRQLRRRRRRGRRRRCAPARATSGFDAARGKYVDLVEAGIIDPTKVVRMALENAVSVGERAAAQRGDDDRGGRAQRGKRCHRCDACPRRTGH